jgi:DNA-directed RNA polymerase subunit K/omega
MSNFKNSQAAKTTITRDTVKLDGLVYDNLFETVVLLSKRANQISKEMKEELSQKLEEFGSHSDNLEEIFENREQIEISKHYERMPKPGSIAIHELEEKQIYYRYPDEQ